MDTTKLPIYISVGAILISVASFSWSIYIGRRDRGKISAFIKYSANNAMTIKMVNSGRRPITLTMILSKYPGNEYCGHYLGEGNKILYFPYISVPRDPWLFRTLLYWDEVGSIVPMSFLENPEGLTPFMRELVREQLVTQIIPMEQYTKYLDLTIILYSIWIIIS